MTYYFAGSYAEIDGVCLSRFGQQVELPEDVAKEAKKKLPLFTEAEFKKFGFTEDELRLYGLPGQMVNAPKEFLAKRAAAQAFHAKQRAAKGA